MRRPRRPPDVFPPSATRDARRLLFTRGARGFADGLVSVQLAAWLSALGFGSFRIGALVTAALIGSAALTLLTGLLGHRLRRRALLLAAAGLMIATGLGFAGITAYWPLLAVAFVGTINPSAGDVTLFLPTEQALLAEVVDARDRTLMFAWYNVTGSLAAAAGALSVGLPLVVAKATGIAPLQAMRGVFLAYSLLGAVAATAYARLSPGHDREGVRPSPLAKSRGVVLKLSGLFSLDAFGGGFVVQSLLALWLFRRFGLSVAMAGAIFFATGVLGGLSQFVASALTRRIGHVRTMVFTHLPSNALLVLAGLAPTAPFAVTCLVLRSLISQMDVPARQAYVMSVVPREERAAASSVTNVPRSLASGLSPLIAGALLQHTTFGWPLLCAGALKALYDVLLYAAFARLHARDT